MKANFVLTGLDPQSTYNRYDRARPFEPAALPDPRGEAQSARSRTHPGPDARSQSTSKNGNPAAIALLPVRSARMIYATAERRPAHCRPLPPGPRLPALVALALLAPGAVAPVRAPRYSQPLIFSTAVFAVGVVASFWTRRPDQPDRIVANGKPVRRSRDRQHGAGHARIKFRTARWRALSRPRLWSRDAREYRLAGQTGDRRTTPPGILGPPDRQPDRCRLRLATLPAIAIWLAPQWAYAVVGVCAISGIILFEWLRPQYEGLTQAPPQLGMRARLALVGSTIGSRYWPPLRYPSAACRWPSTPILSRSACANSGSAISKPAPALACAQAGGLLGRLGWGFLAMRIGSARLVLIGLGLGMAVCAATFGFWGNCPGQIGSICACRSFRAHGQRLERHIPRGGRPACAARPHRRNDWRSADSFVRGLAGDTGSDFGDRKPRWPVRCFRWPCDPRILRNSSAHPGGRAMNAREIAAIVTARRASAVEIARDALDRIAAAKALNAVVTSTANAHWQKRPRSTAACALGDDMPLAGVPVVVKDNIWVEGWRVTQGSLLFADFIAPRDAIAVERLKRPAPHRRDRRHVRICLQGRDDITAVRPDPASTQSGTDARRLVRRPGHGSRGRPRAAGDRDPRRRLQPTSTGPCRRRRLQAILRRHSLWARLRRTVLRHIGDSTDRSQRRGYRPRLRGDGRFRSA